MSIIPRAKKVCSVYNPFPFSSNSHQVQDQIGDTYVDTKSFNGKEINHFYFLFLKGSLYCSLSTLGFVDLSFFKIFIFAQTPSSLTFHLPIPFCVALFLPLHSLCWAGSQNELCSSSEGRGHITLAWPAPWSESGWSSVLALPTFRGQFHYKNLSLYWVSDQKLDYFPVTQSLL